MIKLKHHQPNSLTMKGRTHAHKSPSRDHSRADSKADSSFSLLVYLARQAPRKYQVPLLPHNSKLNNNNFWPRWLRSSRTLITLWTTWEDLKLSRLTPWWNHPWCLLQSRNMMKKRRMRFQRPALRAAPLTPLWKASARRPSPSEKVFTIQASNKLQIQRLDLLKSTSIVWRCQRKTG